MHERKRYRLLTPACKQNKPARLEHSLEVEPRCVEITALAQLVRDYHGVGICKDHGIPLRRWSKRWLRTDGRWAQVQWHERVDTVDVAAQQSLVAETRDCNHPPG